MVILLIAAAGAAFFFVPERLAPKQYSNLICAVFIVGDENIQPTDDQLDQLMNVMQKYKMTRTAKKIYEWDDLIALRLVLSFTEKPGDYTKLCSVNVFKTADGSLAYIGQRTGWPGQMAYSIRGGESLYNELCGLLNEWGYIK